MVGGILASLGMVASSFSGSLSQLFLTAGLITGKCHSVKFGRAAGTAYSPEEKPERGQMHKNA